MNNGCPALIAKARAKYSKNLSRKNYQDLLAKENLSDVVGYLRNHTHYGKYLQTISDDTIRRAQLEEMLRDSLFLRFSELLRYADEKTKNFHQHQIILNEIKQISMYFRSLNSLDKANQIAFTSYQLSRYSKVNFNALLKANDYHQFMDALINTPYYAIFSRFIPREGEKVNYTNIEVALDQYYYQEVKKLVDLYFSNEDKRQVNELINTKIEVENLTRIYRMKKYYKAKPLQIKLNMAPYYQKIKKVHLEKMIDELDAQQFLAELKNTKYSSYISDEPYAHIENYMKKILYSLSKHYLHFSSNASVVMSSYLVLSEIEVTNIIEIIEGKRYNTDSEELIKLLII